MFGTEPVIHRCSSKWSKRPITLLKRHSNAGVSYEISEIFMNIFLQSTSGGCFCCQNRSKETKRYSKKIYSPNIFVEYNDAKKHFDYEILSFGSYEKLSWKNVVRVHFI